MVARSRAVAASTALALAVPLLLSPAPAASAANAPRKIAYRQWDSTAALRNGTLSGTRVVAGTVRLTTPSQRTRIGGRVYAQGLWTSPWVRPGFAFTELVPSWAASTPAGTLVAVHVRGIGVGGRRSSWDTVARWAGTDATFRRTSLGAQRDDLASLATDTWQAHAGVRAWQLRVTLLRRPGTRATPSLGTVGAMVSALPHVDRVSRSTPGVGRGVVLRVPRYSQMVHAGHYPRYGGGGEAWCSPTATTMVLAYYRRNPPPSAYTWVRRSHPDRVVAHAARQTFDHGYDGTGNWPFNTAYAARRTGHAFVTRFASLRSVERFVRAGIPVVTSITFGRGELSGAPIGATNGHLLVVVGFTASGDVVANDPAARTRAGVRRTYDRGEFENAWLRRSPSGGGMRGSGGLAYVVRDGAHPLPSRNGSRAW
jgi:hypothetical protein